jgi:hypothetical protein
VNCSVNLLIISLENIHNHLRRKIYIIKIYDKYKIDEV